jgi:polyisoprenoid-binding protein YceI
MKNSSVLLIAIATVLALAFKPAATKLVSNDTHISFYSHTPLEDITCNNYKVVSTLDQETGEVVFSVPMQSFEFEKELMQKHFNSSDFLDTKKFPKAKFTGKISNLNEVIFTKNGTYNATATGELTIKGVTKPLNATGTITVLNGKITLNSKMNITLADYNISFSKGKPSTNVAKTVEVTTNSIYAPI